MKIGEWESLGRSRSVLQRNLGNLGATEQAAYVSTHPDTGRQRILVATDIGLVDYSWGPQVAEPGSPWYLRGTVYRWHQVQGLRLTTDATVSEKDDHQVVWRLVAQEPKIELVVDSTHEPEMLALLALARACYQDVD
jgi:hypothetical protein